MLLIFDAEESMYWVGLFLLVTKFGRERLFGGLRFRWQAYFLGAAVEIAALLHKASLLRP
jgi:hypothetical protein